MQFFFDLLYVLLDFNGEQFSVINAPNFVLKEIYKFSVQLKLDFRYAYDDSVNKIISERDGQIINLEKQEWYDLQQIDSACTMTIKNSSQH